MTRVEPTSDPRPTPQDARRPRRKPTLESALQLARGARTPEEIERALEEARDAANHLVEQVRFAITRHD